MTDSCKSDSLKEVSSCDQKPYLFSEFILQRRKCSWSLQCKVKLRQKINNYNINFSLEDRLYIAASYLEKCWVEHHYCSNQVLVLGYNNGLCHCFQVRVRNKDKTIIRITVSKHMEQLDTETSVKLFVSSVLIFETPNCFCLTLLLNLPNIKTVSFGKIL